MKIQCVRQIAFCAGHRLLNHEGNCLHLHGHNYRALIYAEAEKLDPLGRVIDFSVLKRQVGTWIETYWDHGFIYYTADHIVQQALTLTQSKGFELPSNPTAENLARYLLEIVCPAVLRDTGVTVTKVILHETDNCFAECSLA